MKQEVEFRYYEIPVGEYVTAKLGKGWEMPYGTETPGLLHFHNYMEIGYCYYGRGKLVINDTAYNYSDDMFSVIPANIAHTTESEDGSVSKWEFLFVDVDGFVRNEMEDLHYSPDEVLRTISKEIVLRRASDDKQMARLILLIMDECRAKNQYSVDIIKGYLRAFILMLLRMTKSGSRLKNINRVNGYVEHAAAFIERHYKEELKVADIASECGLSESHFRRIFEQSTNMKPLDYLNMVRIDKACELIYKEDYQMEEVGRRVGYKTASSFNRNFRALTGKSPLQWKLSQEREGRTLKNYHISAKKGWEK